MQIETLFLALALMLIFEGMLPFVSPQRWREIFRKVTELPDGQIRSMGLVMMGIGLVLLFFFGS